MSPRRHRVVVVTGAGRGVGRAHALRLASLGVQVVVNDLGGEMTGQGGSRGPADEVVAEIVGAGGIAVASHDSVASPEGAQAIVATAVETFGHLDAIINNAGNYRLGAFDEVPIDDFQHLLDVHLFGTLNVTRAAWPYLKSSSTGRVVNTVSLGMLGTAGMGAYSTAKGAVLTASRVMALEGAPHGILVNTVVPAVATRMAEHYADFFSIPRETMTPQQMPAEPLAAVAAHLASEEATGTGKTYSVTGGRVSVVEFAESAGVDLDDLDPASVAALVERAGDLTGITPLEVMP